MDIHSVSESGAVSVFKRAEMRQSERRYLVQTEAFVFPGEHFASQVDLLVDKFEFGVWVVSGEFHALQELVRGLAFFGRSGHVHVETVIVLVALAETVQTNGEQNVVQVYFSGDCLKLRNRIFKFSILLRIMSSSFFYIDFL